MKVILRQPRREIEITEVGRVGELFRWLELVPESFLVIRAGELLTADTELSAEDVVELRPVISGG